MSPAKHLLQFVQSFFLDYLTTQRGLSQHTVFAYRDSLKLFLMFVSKQVRRPPTKLTPTDLQAEVVLAFLNHLEQNRHNSIVTRNLRLAALRTFFKYLVAEDMLHAGQYQRVVAIPLKQRPHPTLEYLEVSEIKAVLNLIDRRTVAGRRDYALLSVLYNSGARVQEICDLKVKDIRFDKPPLATLTGKGKKTRHVPLWSETASLLLAYLKERGVTEQPDACIFVNAHTEPLSRFGVRHIIRSRIAAAAKRCFSLRGRCITPHTIRHSTAMHLLQSGVDLAVIGKWLGHVNLTTTQAYVEIDMEMKRKALATCTPVGRPEELDHILNQHKDVVRWLSAL